MRKNYFILISILLLSSYQLLFAQYGEQVFDDEILHTIHFENVDTNQFIANKKYQQVHMVFDGQRVENIGFKRKGNISGYPETNKYGIKVKTNKYQDEQEFDNIKEFTLHMNYQDPSFLREKLTYEMCAELGLYALKTSFAKVYLNNIYWGLYTLVEGKDEMYKQRFDNRDMDAIESLDFGTMCYLGPNIDEYDFENNGGMPYYTLENGSKESAWPRFVKMLEVANNTPDQNYMEEVNKHINIEDFFIYQALNVYLLNFDSYIGFYGNQIYVYNEAGGRWEVTPWDFNASFGLWDSQSYQYDNYPILPESITTGCIGSKLNTIETLKDYYLGSMCKLVFQVGDTMKMFKRIDHLKNQIKDAALEDKRKMVSNEEFLNSTEFGNAIIFGNNVAGLKSFLRGRYNFIKKELADMNYTCLMNTEETQNPIPLKGITVYPNPANKSISISFPSSPSENNTVKIMDIQGRLLIQTKQVENIDISLLPKGIYILQLSSEKFHENIKFVK